MLYPDDDYNKTQHGDDEAKASGVTGIVSRLGNLVPSETMEDDLSKRQLIKRHVDEIDGYDRQMAAMVKDFCGELEAMRQERDELHDALQTANSTIDQNILFQGTLTTEVASLTALCEQHKAAIVVLEDGNRDLREQSFVDQDLVRTKSDELSSCMMELNGLRKALISDDAVLRDARAELQRTASELDDARSRQDMQEREFAQHLTQRSDDVGRLERTKLDLEKELCELQVVVDGQRTTIDKGYAATELLEAELFKTRTDTDRLVSEHGQVIAAMDAQLEQERESHRETKAQLVADGADHRLQASADALKVDSLQEALTSAECNLERLLGELEEATRTRDQTIERLRKEHDEHSTAAAVAIQSEAALQSELTSVLDDITEMQMQRDAALDDVRTLQVRLASSSAQHQQRVSCVELRLEVMQAELATTSSGIDTIQLQLEKTVLALDKSTKMVQTLQLGILAAGTAFTERITTDNEQLTDLYTMRDTMASSGTEAIAEINSLQRALGLTLAKANQVELNLIRTLETTENLAIMNNVLHDRIIALVDRIKTQDDELYGQSVTIRRLEAGRIEDEDRIKGLGESIAASQGRVGDLEATLCATCAELTTARSDLIAQTNQLHANDVRHRAAAKSIKAQLKKIGEIKGTVRAVELELGTARHANDELRAAHDDIARQRDAAEQDRVALQAKVSAALASAAERQLSLASTQAELETVRTGIDAERASARFERQELKASLNQLQARLALAEATTAHLQSERQHATVANDHHVRLLSEAQVEATHLRAELDRLRADDGDDKALRAEMSRLADQVAEDAAVKRDLGDRVLQLTTRIQELKRRRPSSPSRSGSVFEPTLTLQPENQIQFVAASPTFPKHSRSSTTMTLDDTGGSPLNPLQLTRKRLSTMGMQSPALATQTKMHRRYQSSGMVAMTTHPETGTHSRWQV